MPTKASVTPLAERVLDAETRVSQRLADGNELCVEWRGDFENNEINALHAVCFEHPISDYDWAAKLDRFSLGWTCARQSEKLVGFVNVAWDGGVHAFILDTMVDPSLQRHGVARRLITLAIDGSRQAGCDWLHVDFEASLRPFYLESCGFRPTDAGVLPLK
ncbi:GNAT family N-acetyltransferase [Pseudomonas syringae]|uniref:GNAT family N-acetyltransferase n=1 Tax=Pseudomonas sp. MWU16-30316 TaxID=2878093 RepID=UPI0010FFE86C|nr:GNAT family N-acetyltransferase [Pseudomonas sp. MWU16-30316]TFZ36158.1 GNAT family N-acetyltransferase [Pseudomonas syringae]